MKIDSELLKLLMEIGFLSANKGRLDEAKTIFDGVVKARPQSAYPQIGLGCVAMGEGDFPKAVEILRNAPVKEEKERDLCHGFLGMALKLAGFNDESRALLSQLQAEGVDATAVKMAGQLLEKF